MNCNTKWKSTKPKVLYQRQELFLLHQNEKPLPADPADVQRMKGKLLNACWLRFFFCKYCLHEVPERLSDDHEPLWHMSTRCVLNGIVSCSSVLNGHGGREGICRSRPTALTSR